MTQDFCEAFAISETEKDDARRFKRWDVNFETTLTMGQERIPCLACDISPGGVGVELKTPVGISVGDRLTIDVPEFGAVPAQVRYNGDGYLGLMFVHEATSESALAKCLIELVRAQEQGCDDDALATKVIIGGNENACRIADLTESKAHLALDGNGRCTVGQHVSVHLFELGFVIARVVAVADNEIEVIFVEPLSRLPRRGRAASAGSATLPSSDRQSDSKRKPSERAA